MSVTLLLTASLLAKHVKQRSKSSGTRLAEKGQITNDLRQERVFEYDVTEYNLLQEVRGIFKGILREEPISPLSAYRQGALKDGSGNEVSSMTIVGVMNDLLGAITVSWCI